MADELTQRRSAAEQREWDELLAATAGEMMGICPLCGSLAPLAECGACDRLVCAACFERHACWMGEP